MTSPQPAPTQWSKLLRKHAATSLLVALVAVFGVVVLVWDKGNVTTGEAERRKNNLFDAWRSDDVTEVRITAQGRTGTLLRKTGDAGDHTWDVELDGQRHAAEEQLVADYLGRLEFAEAKPGRRRIAPESVDRAAFKLDAPRVSLSVKMGKLGYDLVVGGPAPSGGVYVEVAGKGVSEVTAQLADALDVAPDSFRSRKIAPYTSVDLVGLQIDGEGGARRFERAPWSGGRGAGFRWAPGTAHAGQRVDARSFDKVLVALGQLQATRFLSAAPPGDGRITLTLQPKSGPPAVIVIGAACPEEPESVVVVRKEPDPVVACASLAARDALAAPPEAFVDQRVVGAEADEIIDVQMTAGQNKLELARAGAGWHMRAPVDRKVEADEGRAFVDALISVAGTRLASAEEASAFGEPRATVRVVSPVGIDAADAGVDRTELIEVGAEGKQLTPVRRREDGAVLMVQSDAARALLPRDLALRGKKVWSESSRRVTSLRVETSKLTQRVERGGEGWKLLEPAGKGLRADPGLCNDLAEAMTNLNAERWIADLDDGAFGLERPRIVIEAELGPGDGPDAGAPRKLSLSLGTPTSGGAFARASGDPAIFVAPRSIELAADKLLVDRQLLAVDTTKLKQVSVTRGEGERIVMLREGTAWKIGEPAGDPAASTKVTALLSALDDLSADEAVVVGPTQKQHGLDKPRFTFVLEGSEPTARIVVGGSDSLHGLTVYYVRKEGVDATFAVAQAKLRQLEAAW